LAVVADETDDALWVQVRVDHMVIEIPIDVVARLLERARGEVHSEGWFERQQARTAPDGDT